MRRRDAKPTFEPHGTVWLGDFLWAIAKTTVGDATQRRAWAAELLDLDSFARERGGEAPPTAADMPSAERESDVDALRRAPTSRVGKRPPNEVFSYGIVTQQRNEDPSRTRAWLQDAPPLPDVETGQLTARPPLEPLFLPQTTRTLLSTALSTRRDEGDIDFERVVEGVSRRRPLTELPRRPIATLRFGIQLLVDRGAGMWPYFDDQKRLREAILAVAGRERVETLYFADSPLRGCGRGGRRTWKAYQCPPAGTPAVLLTDLGLAGTRKPGIGASEDEWLDFAKLLRGAECPVLAFLPYGQHRWPLRLRRAFSLLPWDRGTSVSVVRRLLGSGLTVAATL